MFAFLLCLASVAWAGWPDLSTDLAPGRDGAGDAAVIVAIERYDAVPDIAGAVANGEDWRRWLHVSRGVPLSNIRLLRDADATRELMLEEAEWAASRVREGGTLWWVFIGHGAPSEDGQDGVLVGSDARQTARSLYARSVRRAELLDRLETGPQEQTVLVLDACFSGRASADDVLVAGLQPLLPVTLAAPRRAIILSAGGGDEFAGPLPGADRPAFSYLLLGALRGWGDADGDGVVTAEEAIRYAEGALSVLVTDRRQTPRIEAPDHAVVLGRGSEAGPDLLALVDHPRATPAPRMVAEAADFNLEAMGAVAEALRRERCEQAARERARAAQAAEMAARVEALDAELAAQWQELRGTANSCAASGDAELRLRCRQQVEAFAEHLAGRSVRRSAGFEQVDSDCGPVHVPVAEASQPAGQEVLAEVRAFIAAYGPDGGRSDCRPGQLRHRDFQGQCCWPGQAWDGRGCVGTPSACPSGLQAIGSDCLSPVEQAFGPASLAAPQGQPLRISDAASRPVVIAGRSEGGTEVRRWAHEAPGCEGRIDPSAGTVVHLERSFRYLRFELFADAEATLVISGPNGSIYCNPGHPGPRGNVLGRALVEGPFAKGRYVVHVGRVEARVAWRLVVSEHDRSADQDGDGVPDHLDACPNEPAFWWDGVTPGCPHPWLRP